jgi:hypothetical protein
MADPLRFDLNFPDRPMRDELGYPSAAELAAEGERDSARAAWAGLVADHEYLLPFGPEDFDPKPAWRSPEANR